MLGDVIIIDDSLNTTTATIIPEEVPLAPIKPRRSSIFRATITEPKNDDDVGVNEYKGKVKTVYKNWREHYEAIKDEYIVLKSIVSKPTQKTHHYSEDYQELLSKAENYVDKANDYFDQIKCISAMNQNHILFKENITQELEVRVNASKEYLRNLINKSE